MVKNGVTEERPLPYVAILTSAGFVVIEGSGVATRLCLRQSS